MDMTLSKHEIKITAIRASTGMTDKRRQQATYTTGQQRQPDGTDMLHNSFATLMMPAFSDDNSSNASSPSHFLSDVSHHIVS